MFKPTFLGIGAGLFFDIIDFGKNNGKLRLNCGIDFIIAVNKGFDVEPDNFVQGFVIALLFASMGTYLSAFKPIIGISYVIDF